MIQTPRWLRFGRLSSNEPTSPTNGVASRIESPSSQPATSPPGLSVFKSLESPGSPVEEVMGGVEKDTDGLFRSRSVEEIKRIEQQTRLDIDRRKEDLRQMVG